MADLETMFFIVGLIIGFIVGVVIGLLIVLLCMKIEEVKNERKIPKLIINCETGEVKEINKRKGDKRYDKTR